MKVNIAIEHSLAKKKYYLIINDSFYINISKKMFFELVEFLSIKGVKNDKQRKASKP